MKGCGFLRGMGSAFRLTRSTPSTPSTPRFPDNLPKLAWGRVVNYGPMQTIAALQSVGKRFAEECEQEINPEMRKIINQFKESLANGRQISDLVKKPTPDEKKSFESLLENDLKSTPIEKESNDLSTNGRAQLRATIQLMMTDEQKGQVNEVLKEIIREFNFYTDKRYKCHCAFVLGADPNQADDKDGLTVLHKASSRGYTALVKALVEKGANLNICDEGSNTALGEAAMKGHIDCMKVLLDAGAQTNLLNSNGDTVLHLPTHLGNISAVKTLLDAGIDLNLLDGNGRTALQWATERSQTVGGYDRVIALLKQASEQYTPAEGSEA